MALYTCSLAEQRVKTEGRAASILRLNSQSSKYITQDNVQICASECSANAIIYGTVSAKIAPRLKCYKNASRLNRYNFPTDNAIDFLFSTLHTTPFHYEVLKIGSR